MLFKKKIILIVFFWLAAGLSNQCLAQQTSARFIASLTDSLLNLAAAQLPIEGKKQAVLKGLEDTPNINWFFEDRLLELLRQESITHIYFDDQAEQLRDSSNSRLVFEYKVLKLNIKYSRQSGNSNSLQRIAEVGFFLRVIEQTAGTILLNKNFEATKTEWLQLNQADLQESHDADFNQRQLRPQKGSILQPVLISSIAGIIIYLFYAVRSR